MLADDVRDIQNVTGSNKIFLIAHSMGGLICRFAIQYDIFGFRDKVAKFITLATPHGGASLADKLILGKNFINPGSKDLEHLDPDWVKKYLGGTKINKNNFISQNNCYCVVGCNYKDYGITKGLVGGRSDGLVMQNEAFINGVGKTFVYCTHSSIRNNRESYEITKRFFFGDVRMKLTVVKIKFKDKQRKGNWQYCDRRYFFYSSFKLRGVNALLNEISERCENTIHHSTAEEIQDMIETTGYVLYDGFLDSTCISLKDKRKDGGDFITFNLEFECMEYDQRAGDMLVETASIPFQLNMNEAQYSILKEYKGKHIDFDVKIEYEQKNNFA